MSHDVLLYRADKDTPLIEQWNRNLAFPIGTEKEVQEGMSKLFPNLSWSRFREDFPLSGSGGTCDPYFDVSLNDFREPDGLIYAVSWCKPEPWMLIKTMEYFRLTHAAWAGLCCFVDPYRSTPEHYETSDTPVGWDSGNEKAM